jgi:hypothetical protein
MYYNDPWEKLERISELVERERHTLYGAQLQLGLARGLFSIVQSRPREGSSVPLPPRITATLERVKSLLAQEPPITVGLERSLARLRADIVADAHMLR